MTRASIRSRLTAMEMESRRRTDPGGSNGVQVKLQTMAARFLSEGVRWERYPVTEHLAVARARLQSGEADLAQAKQRGQAVLDGPPCAGARRRTSDATA